MSPRRGMIALMGSGELTATMVEVHRELLTALGDRPQAVFLDTPAGFQLNVDGLSERAIEFFRTHVQQPMVVASFRSKERTPPYEAERAFHILREADFILIGPGSPSYAVRQWRETPVPEIFVTRIETGGCLVAASAAALTVGRLTLPVYEIYKVGESPHWVEGIDILGRFDLNLVAIPHWNNAEGGTHDTRFCYMGEPRFRMLESLLPGDVSILGLDEHTACLIDLERGEASVRGIGRVTLRHQGAELSFLKGDRFSLDLLRGKRFAKGWRRFSLATSHPRESEERGDSSFWERIRTIEATFRTGLEKDEPRQATNALLELDEAIWGAQQDLENEEFISQAREILREFIVLLGMRLESSPGDKRRCLAPLVEEMLQLREKFRLHKHWREADAIRESLQRAGVLVEDTRNGPLWRLT